MFDRLKDILLEDGPVKIPQEHQCVFSIDLLKHNIKREKMLSLILILTVVCVGIIDLAISVLWNKSLQIFARFPSLYINLMMAAMFYSLLHISGKKLNAGNIRYYSVLHCCLVVITLSLNAMASAKGNIFVYMIVMFCVSSILILPRIEAIFVNVSPLLVFGFILIRQPNSGNAELRKIFLLALLTIMTVIVADMRFNAFAEGFMARITIMEKNRELKELAALTEATFDSIPDIIMVYDSQLKLQHYNKAAEKMYQAGPGYCPGHNCIREAGNKAGCCQAVIKNVFLTKKHARMECCNNDSSKWLEMRAYPLLDDEGNVSKVIQHIRDITYLKKFEEELQRKNSILKTQLEASPDGIIVVDEKWRVISFNNKFLEVWNIPGRVARNSDSEMLLKFLFANVVDRDVLEKEVKEMETTMFEATHCKIRLVNGTILDCHTIPILLFEGESYGRVCYFRDITEKVKMDEALRQSAAENERLLKESLKYDELKSEFFANISHELRTPINVLLGTLQLIQMKQANNEGDNEKSKITDKYIRIMRQNCYRLLRMTNNLIDITKMDTGFFKINLQNYNIVQVVEDITVSVAEYIENKGISLIFDTDIEEKVMAVDADKIERILLNLLSNAVKFTKTDGAIWVNIHDKGENIEISVRDTGIGIPEDMQKIIFERFRQVNSSLTRSSEGSGIGLSLVKSLVEMHGGYIRVISELNKGSEFIIDLPCRTVNETEVKKPDRSSHVERINIEFSDIYA